MPPPPYIYEHSGWPRLIWDQQALMRPLLDVRYRQGRLLGQMEALGFGLREEAVLQTLTRDVLDSSEIEGEVLDKEQVRSSIARRLGLDIGASLPTDRNVEGVVEMMLDATQRFDAPLTADRLFDWHASLFPTGRSGMTRIRAGAWRDDSSGPMQVVSGPIGRAHVHFQAPAASQVEQEMAAFLAWFQGDTSLDPVAKAGLAHLWFLTIHPFDDGNGRIGRAISDMALARAEESARRFYSLSAQIRLERAAYYRILEKTQSGGLDVTAWMAWFLGCLDRAIQGAESTLAVVLTTSHFWTIHAAIPLNDRQRRMVGKLLDGFQGKLTSSKWAAVSKCSQDTALRDILDLVRKGILAPDPAGGRSTSYSFVRDEEYTLSSIS